MASQKKGGITSKVMKVKCSHVYLKLWKEYEQPICHVLQQLQTKQQKGNTNNNNINRRNKLHNKHDDGSKDAIHLEMHIKRFLFMR